MNPQAGKPAPQARSERGVALVVTLIMLALITFLTVAFLALSRRERASVGTTIEQTDTRLGAETATERAIADVVAEGMARNNLDLIGPRASQNYINPMGYQSGNPNDPEIASPTNVSYQFPNGNPLSGGPPNYDAERNIANLLYDPRPPVYVTNPATGTMESRFYHDLNRNGRFDPSGLQPVVGSNGFYLDLNGNASIPTNSFPLPRTTLSNSFLGDPQWIGILERSDLPHSSSNFFKSRYAYLVLPYGNTLDVNAMHHQTFSGQFLRNQGAGTWEINLGAFFADLHTNAWRTYSYLAPFGGLNGGVTFNDAATLWNYRNPDYPNNPRKSVADMFGPAGVAAFQSDGIDGYANGPLFSGLIPPTTDNDPVGNFWVGADSANRYFSHQDFFDRAKVGPQFLGRLGFAMSGPSTYDQNTFYRMISQLGMDSPPDTEERVHLNYDNKVRANPVTGIVSPTNFYAWTPIALFTNAVDAMLDRAGFRVNVGTEANPNFEDLSSTNIPVGRMVMRTVGTNTAPEEVWQWEYTSSINRILQLAANIVDATTNRLERQIFAGGSGREPIYAPTVFKPIFTNINNGEIIRIVGFEEVENFDVNQSNPLYRIPLDIEDESARANLLPDDNVFGVPLVMGAKKGLPNFNEYSMQTVAAVTRRLELRRQNTTSQPNETNQMYVVSIDGRAELEAWNSYTSAFPVEVEMYAYNVTSLELTNSYTQPVRFSFTNSTSSTVPANTWQGFQASPGTMSFRVPLTNSFVLASNATWRANRPPTGFFQGFGFERNAGFPVPDFGLQVTNNLRFFIIAKSRRGRPYLVDYVQLNNLGTRRSIGSELLQGPEAQVVPWRTNRFQGDTIQNPTIGIVNQINISLGNHPVPGFPEDGEWNNYGVNQPSKHQAIDGFRRFFGLSPIYFPDTPQNTELVVQAPFTPTRKMYQYQTWQANDPLVHYMETDLRELNRTNLIDWAVPPSQEVDALSNVRKINDRYAPWGGNPNQSEDPNRHNLALKDPLVGRSDHWNFPTNKFPNIGWLGRVHRGTPWQTMYLKSEDIDDKTWKEWTGNSSQDIEGNDDATRTKPFNDHNLLDLFTVALNDNATRGQLSVNQTNLASWSAVLSGVLALTNDVPNNVLSSSHFPRVETAPVIIEPVGINGTNAPLWTIYEGINRTRADTNLFPNGVFRRMGHVLRTPELTVRSPYLNTNEVQRLKGISDELYERIPQMILSLLKTGDSRFVVYSYGQSLKPAERSIVQSGPFFGMCTNYQITGEMVTRSVVRIDGSLNDPNDPPRAVIESFNVLPPE